MSMSTSAYDPERHDNQIVAMYDTDTQARSAREALVKSGVPESAIQVVARGGDMGMTGGDDSDTGMWGAVRSLFVPDEERNSFTHAVGHGHAMLVVTPMGGMSRETVIHTLEGTNPIDFDAKLQEWDKSGYDYKTPHPAYVSSAQAMQGSTTGPTAGGMAAGMASTSAADAGYDTRMAATAPVAKPVTTPAVAMKPPAVAATAPNDGMIEVIDEQLRIGKREVATGAVRVRSYIVERPVEEQVRLREEHISVDRRPVDRPADGAAFQDRTIEARATSEEAVISKDVRVVEEIGLRKEASERVETVRDTVRHTEVEIEDGTASTAKTGTAKTGPITTGTKPNN